MSAAVSLDPLAQSGERPGLPKAADDLPNCSGVSLKQPTARCRGGADGSALTKQITAFERWVDAGMDGPITFLSASTKDFVPLPIDWANDARILERSGYGFLVSLASDGMREVSDALEAGRVTGSAHYPTDGSAPVASRLDDVARAYTRWRRGKLPGEALYELAAEVAAFIRAAPRPKPAPDVPENKYTHGDRVKLAELVKQRCAPWSKEEVEEAAHRELAYGNFDAHHTLEDRARLAVFRAEYDVKSRRQRERSYGDPEIANPIRLGRAPSRGRGSEPDTDGEGKQRAAENSLRRNSL